MAAVYKTLLVNQQLLELTKKLEYIVDSTIFFHGLRRHAHLEMNCDPFLFFIHISAGERESGGLRIQAK
jgi:hypothetical protein